MNADDFHALYQVLSDPDIMRDAKVLAESGNDCASKFEYHLLSLLDRTGSN